MKVRFFTALGIAVFGIPILIFSHTIAFPIALSVVSLIATYEILRVIGGVKYYSLAIPSYVLAVTLPLGGYFAKGNYKEYIILVALVLSVFLLYLFSIAVFMARKITFSKIAESFSSVTYITACLTAMCILRYLPNGMWNLILVIIGAWISDIFAYIVGTLFGKHKLIPSISPKKSVEGSIAGVVLTAGVFVLYGYIISRVTSLTPNYLVLLISGIIVPIISQLGDLMASLIKREYGVKDFSNILPGHGGILDRFDSVIPVSMVLLIVCTVFPPFI